MSALQITCTASGLVTDVTVTRIRIVDQPTIGHMKRVIRPGLNGISPEASLCLTADASG